VIKNRSTPGYSKIEEEQKKYYNKIAEDYNKHYGNTYALQYRYSQYDLCLGDIDLKGKKVLDAMCGGGEATGYLLMRGARVTGIDISNSCCEIYHQKFPDCEIICKSFLDQTICESEECFDLILTDSLHHLNPYINEAMEQVYRLLKPGGYFCFWEPSSGSLIDLIRKVWYRLDRTYFLQNEVSIDIKSLFDSPKIHFEKLKTIYGGNVAYVLVNLSMALRIPVGIVNFYAPLMIKIERFLQPIQCRLLSAWVLCLVKKRDDI